MGLNILIVDDSSIIRASIKKSLTMINMEINSIFEGTNGLEALTVLSEQWIDIVFADINMPIMNGVELVNKMSQNNLLDTIPVVIVSTNRSKPQIEELKEKGVKGYITKPFRPEDFRDIIRKLLY